MKREHGVVLALLLVLLVAAGLVVLTGRAPEAGSIDDQDREPPVAGRALRIEEVSGSCTLAGEPVTVGQSGGLLGSCTIRTASTDEPFWSIPLLERFLQPELRQLTVRLTDCGAAGVEIHDVSESLAEGDELSIAIQADGATLTFRSAPECRLVTDVTSG